MGCLSWKRRGQPSKKGPVPCAPHCSWDTFPWRSGPRGGPTCPPNSPGAASAAAGSPLPAAEQSACGGWRAFFSGGGGLQGPPVAGNWPDERTALEKHRQPTDCSTCGAGRTRDLQPGEEHCWDRGHLGRRWHPRPGPLPSESRPPTHPHLTLPRGWGADLGQYWPRPPRRPPRATPPPPAEPTPQGRCAEEGGWRRRTPCPSRPGATPNPPPRPPLPARAPA